METDQRPSADGPEQAEQTKSYQPPSVEDLDSSYGPSVTAAGGTGGPASPREL